MAKICTVNYCCDGCGRPITVNFDVDMIEDKDCNTILKEKFCKLCGRKLTAAEKLSTMFVTAVRNTENEIKTEKESIINDKEKYENEKYEFEKKAHEQIERLKNEKAKLDNDIIRFEKKEADIKFTTENLMRDNIFTQKRIEEYKNKKAERERLTQLSKGISENDMDELTGNIKGCVIYNRLVNSADSDNNIQMRAFANDIYLQITPDGVFEETDERGILCYIRDTDEEDLFELYPSVMIKYSSAKKNYTELYHFDGDGSIVNVKDVCFVRKRGEIYKVEKTGKIIFEKRFTNA